MNINKGDNIRGRFCITHVYDLWLSYGLLSISDSVDVGYKRNKHFYLIILIKISYYSCINI
jgi:hypothetical protein